MNKIIISYCRVSSTQQATEGYGLEIQKRTNNEAIEHLIVAGAYTRLPDIMEVGSAFKGDNFQEIFDNAKAGKYPKGSMIVMFDQTRFSRAPFAVSTAKMVELINTGVEVHYSSTNETITSDTINDVGGYIGQLIKQETANKESELRKARTKGSYETKIANGELVTVGAVPNWLRKVYDVSGNKPVVTHYELIPERQIVIETIFKMYIAGNGATSITAYLNQNVPTWNEFDHRRKNKDVKVWRESYVTKLLNNPAIDGTRVFNVNQVTETRKEDYFPRAVSKSLWVEAQEVRATRSVTSGTNKYPTNFMTGLLRCGYCGSRYGLLNLKSKSAVIRCTAHAKQEVTNCHGGSSASKLLERVLIEFCSDSINYNTIFTTEAPDVSQLKVEVHQLKQEIASNNGKLQKLEDLYFDGDITKDRYISRKKEFESTTQQQQVLALEQEIEFHTHKSTDDEVEFIELLAQLKADSIPEATRLKLRDLLPKFIDRVIVSRYGRHASLSPAYKQAPVKNKKALEYKIIFKSGKSRVINHDGKHWYLNNTGDNDTLAGVVA